MYLLLKLLHILFAVTAVGANLTYAAWFARAAREESHLAFTLRGVKFLDDWVANPAYVGLGVTGPLMVWLAGYAWTQTWVWASIATLTLTSILGLGVYTPLLRRQLAALAAGGPQDPLFLQLGRRGAWMGLGFGALNLFILYLMVYKPV